MSLVICNKANICKTGCMHATKHEPVNISDSGDPVKLCTTPAWCGELEREVVCTSSNEDNKVYQFVEPHPTGGSAVVTITGDQILEYMKKAYPEKSKELSDEQLIQDFCSVHWASEVTEQSEDD